MNKYFLILISLIILSSCTFNERQMDVQPNRQSTSESNIITRVLMPEEDLVYKNNIAGYQITFPKSWRGYYKITEYTSGRACISFYGRSKTGQSYFKNIEERTSEGIALFWIVEYSDPDSHTPKIGEVNGVEYFFLQYGGYDLDILRDISDLDSFAGRNAEFEIDKTEITLAEEDLEKANQMHKDIDEILKTFTAIE